MQSQYNAQKAGITSAIVIAVLLPIGICGFCLMLQLRNRAAERREEKEGRGYYDQTNNAAAGPERESKPMYEPNITNSGPGTSRSSSSSGGRKKKIGRGDSDDRDSGIQATEVKLHDDGRVTMNKENERFQQDAIPKDSPISSLKNGIIKANGVTAENRSHPSGGSRHGSLSGVSKTSRQPSKDEFLLSLENDRGENEMVVGNPTFNEVVARRSPVGRLASSDNIKNDNSSGSSGKASSPRVPLPTGTTSSSDGSNLPSSARSSSRSDMKGRITSVPLQKQAGSTLVGKDKYSIDRSPLNQNDNADASPSPTESNARYDGEYYTREPLNNKPSVDFPTKTMDVDIDFNSYNPHGNRPSAL